MGKKNTKRKESMTISSDSLELQEMPLNKICLIKELKIFSIPIVHLAWKY